MKTAKTGEQNREEGSERGRGQDHDGTCYRIGRVDTLSIHAIYIINFHLPCIIGIIDELVIDIACSNYSSFERSCE